MWLTDSSDMICQSTPSPACQAYDCFPGGHACHNSHRLCAPSLRLSSRERKLDSLRETNRPGFQGAYTDRAQWNRLSQAAESHWTRHRKHAATRRMRPTSQPTASCTTFRYSARSPVILEDDTASLLADFTSAQQDTQTPPSTRHN